MFDVFCVGGSFLCCLLCGPFFGMGFIVWCLLFVTCSFYGLGLCLLFVASRCSLFVACRASYVGGCSCSLWFVVGMFLPV